MSEHEPVRLSKRPRPDWRQGAKWFAAEFAVVVSGVLVALALNAWWGGYQDAAAERTYLRQLLSDLNETLRLVDGADAAMWHSDRAGGLLVRAFQMPKPPPQDSLFAWARAASRYRYPNPVTGTAEALIATGDLTLLRDDALRTKIVGYLSESKLIAEDFRNDAVAWERAREDLFQTLDYQEVLATLTPQSVTDSLATRYPDFPLPAGERRGQFPFDAEEFLSNHRAYDALVRMNRAKTNMRWDREALRKATQSLKARVEAAL